MKIKSLLLATSIALVASASATVTLTFNSAGFLGEAGQTSGISWGVVVDGSGDGLFNFNTSSGIAPIALTNNLVIPETGDDFLYMSANKTLALGPNAGFITLAAGITDAPGNAFGIMWFDSALSAADQVAQAGQKYGFYTQANFIMPAPGSAVTIAAVPGSPGNASLTFVPEPSAVLLGALGALGLLRRRRN